MAMRHAISFMPSGELSDPRACAEVAQAAEAAGWDGVFVWDHVLRSDPEPRTIADPWVTMAAMAMVTERVRLGPMVTPVTRRRPIKLAREAVSVDHLSNGRVTLGLGLGVDHSRELSGVGEIVDARVRGQRLDEGAELLARWFTGDTVTFHGEHFVADGIQLLPPPVQRPRIPMWFAARGDARKPVRRAARYDGLVPVEVDTGQLEAMVELLVAERGSLDGFDVALMNPTPDQLETGAALGVTWFIKNARPGVTAAELIGRVAAGPPR